MTDDRDTDFNGTGFEIAQSDCGDWDALLNGAFSGLLFDTAPAAAHFASVVDDPLHAAFEALLFGDSETSLLIEPRTHVRVWVANDDTAPAGFGRIMLSRESDTVALTELSGVLDRDGPQINANPAIASGHAANDNTIWIGSGGDTIAGVYGRDPSVAVLDNGDALVAWIGADDGVHAALLAAGDDANAVADRSKLDHVLAGLSDAAAASGGKAGRVVVTPAGQFSFAALWTTEFALNSVLMGTLLTLTPSAAASDGDSSGHVTWTLQDIPARPVPPHTSAFDVALTGDGTLSVTFTDDNGGSETITIADWSGSAGDDTVDADDSGLVATAGAQSPLTAPSSDGATDDPAQIVSSEGAGVAESAADHSGNDDGIVPPITVIETTTIAGGANDTVQQVRPDIAISGDGSPTALHIVPGPALGDPVTIIITPLDQHGHASGQPVVVTSNAIIHDTDHPTLDVTPDIAGTSDGVAVAWVARQGQGEATVKALQIQAFDGDSQPLSSAPVTVVQAHGERASFSDVATGYSERTEASGNSGGADHGQGTDGESADGGGLLAVAWVQDASADGYGTISAQLFSVTSSDDSDAGHGLTAVGEDGRSGGDDDGPFQLSCGADDGNSDALGRAPQIEGLGDGALAVAWVEHESGNSGHEVVRGVVMTPCYDEASTDLDLAPLMPRGIASGTSPILASDSVGDLIVAWMQAALAGGYEAASAIFRHGDDGQFTPPTAAMILNHFDSIPEDFAIAVSGSGDDISLVLAWRDDDNNVAAVRYDVETDRASPEFTVYTDDDHNDGGGLGLANLPDGELLVVYATNDGSDSDISATLLDIDGGSNSGSGKSGDADREDNSGRGNASDRSDSDTIVSSSSENSGKGSNCDEGRSADSDRENSARESSIDDDNSDSGKSDSSGSGSQKSGNDSASAVANYDNDLIQFLVDDAEDGSEQTAIVFSWTSTDSDEAPGSQTGSGAIAALEAFAQLADETAGGASDQADTGGGDAVPANDNVAAAYGDATLAFVGGYGNDITDYISAEEQAASIPEPIALLFEALQFANAFDDAANNDVLVFDMTNVVTISQFQTADAMDSRFDLPLT
ncbi:MAG: hypothetical protein ABL897_15740 [Hyphomicrobium sp.]